MNIFSDATRWLRGRFTTKSLIPKPSQKVHEEKKLPDFSYIKVDTAQDSFWKRVARRRAARNRVIEFHKRLRSMHRDRRGITI